MSPYLLIVKNAISPIAKALAPTIKKAIMTKAIKEVSVKLEGDEKETFTQVSTDVVSGKKSTAWASVAILTAYFASSQGWVSPEVANFINSLLSNPFVIEAIETSVD
jgi:hypothetical protein